MLGFMKGSLSSGMLRQTNPAKRMDICGLRKHKHRFSWWEKILKGQNMEDTDTLFVVYFG